MLRRLRERIEVGLAALVLAAVGVLGYAALYGFLTATDARRADEEALHAVERVVALIRSAESGQRGYLITGEAGYLDPYRQATAALGPALVTLRGRRLCPPAEVNAFERAARAKIEEIEATVTWAGSGRRDAALAAVRSGEGRRLMTEVRLHARRIVACTGQALGRRERRAATLARVALVALPVGGLGGLALLAVALRAGMQQASLRLRAEAAAEARLHEAEHNTFLLNAISHDLRTPLQSIGYEMALAQMYVDAPGKVPVAEIRRAMVSAQESATAVGVMLDGMLAIARAEREGIHTYRTVAVRDVLADVVRFVKPNAELKGLTFELDCPQGLLVHTCPHRVQRIILNLASNAVKFTPSGSVRLEAARDDDRGVLVRVKDTGPGIPPELVRRFGRDFVQGDNPERTREKGFGLGVSIACRLAHQLDGEISVASAPGAGSTFTVRLPDLKEQEA